jgi:hypothetical protein
MCQMAPQEPTESDAACGISGLPLLQKRSIAYAVFLRTLRITVFSCTRSLQGRSLG